MSGDLSGDFWQSKAQTDITKSIDTTYFFLVWDEVKQREVGLDS